MATQNETAILRLLSNAEKSLAAYLVSEPNSPRKFLAQLYTYTHAHVAELALSGDAFDVFPDARNLYWDEPITALEKQCMDDAFALFYYIRHECKLG